MYASVTQICNSILNALRINLLTFMKHSHIHKHTNTHPQYTYMVKILYIVINTYYYDKINTILKASSSILKYRK